jgi:hypothetical protein
VKFLNDATLGALAFVAGVIAVALVIGLSYFAGQLCAHGLLHFC